MESCALNLLRLVKNNVFSLHWRRLCTKVNSFTWRTHSCGELRGKHVGQEVTLCGWITFQRCDKFVVLKDCYGITQVLFDEHDTANRNFAFSLPLESVVQVKGIIRKRPLSKINKKIPTGEIEIEAKELMLLNSCIRQLPFTSREYEKAGEPTKQKYRYLSLRMMKTQKILRARSKFIMNVREFLHNQHGFVEVETPTLFKRTPGGAKEFVVPTKFPGRFYSLVQSPQQFKQMLMVGSIDRYFQIARCYRNEGTKADRQPEFTQIDIEVSFTTAENIRSLVEQMLQNSWPTEKPPIQIPFPCITYSDAMRIYGTDKPDMRYGITIQNMTEYFTNQGLNIFDYALTESNCIAAAIVLPFGSKFIRKSHIEEFQEKAKLYSLPDLIEIRVKNNFKWKSVLAKHVSMELQNKINDVLQVKENDLILIATGNETKVHQLLGKVRVECAEHLSSNFELYKADELSFNWVVDFPLFLANEEGDIESAHHPFTAPHPNDVDLVYTNPVNVRSQHYDLVLNGQEVGGGSIRIHDSELQNYVLKDVLKEDSSDLQHLLDALKSGCPPHGGIALGVDRLIAIMNGCHSISEVIAFPKSADGKDLLSGAPAPITEEDKLLYHIEPKIPEDVTNELPAEGVGHFQD